MVMNGIVLAGGFATRLWPITRHRPKMLLPLGETTVIDRILQDLEDDDRIDDVYVSTNEEFAPTFEEHLAAADYEKATLSVEEARDESEKFGVIAALAQLLKREGITDDTLVIAGDNLIGASISDILDHFDESDGPTLAAHDVESHERATQYGVVAINDGVVTSFDEKPADPQSTLVSIACYGLPEDTVALLDQYLEEGTADELGEFIEWLVERDTVYGYAFEEPWYDIGTAESYLDAVAWHLDNGSYVADSATVTDTDIGPGVQVLAGADVDNAELEHTVVFPEANVTDSDLSSTIIDEHATVIGQSLVESKIGGYSTVRADSN